MSMPVDPHSLDLGPPPPGFKVPGNSLLLRGTPQGLQEQHDMPPGQRWFEDLNPADRMQPISNFLRMLAGAFAPR